MRTETDWTRHQTRITTNRLNMSHPAPSGSQALSHLVPSEDYWRPLPSQRQRSCGILSNADVIRSSLENGRVFAKIDLTAACNMIGQISVVHSLGVGILPTRKCSRLRQTLVTTRSVESSAQSRVWSSLRLHCILSHWDGVSFSNQLTSIITKITYTSL